MRRFLYQMLLAKPDYKIFKALSEKILRPNSGNTVNDTI